MGPARHLIASRVVYVELGRERRERDFGTRKWHDAEVARVEERALFDAVEHEKLWQRSEGVESEVGQRC